MRIVIIGGSGHVGTYLVPHLVVAGHDVVVLSRGQRAPYQPHAAWQQVEQIAIDREAEEAAGSFGRRVRDLKPDIVIDMICFTLASAQQLVEALRDEVGHFLHCGTIWVHGPSVEVPTTEAQPRRPFGAYGEQKAAIEAFLLEQARRQRFPATVLHADLRDWLRVCGAGVLRARRPVPPRGRGGPPRVDGALGRAGSDERQSRGAGGSGPRRAGAARGWAHPGVWRARSNRNRRHVGASVRRMGWHTEPMSTR